MKNVGCILYFIKKYSILRRFLLRCNVIGLISAVVQAASAVVFGRLFAAFSRSQISSLDELGTYFSLAILFWLVSVAMTRLELVTAAKLREYSLLCAGRSVSSAALSLPIREVNTANAALSAERYNQDCSATVEVIVVLGSIAKPLALLLTGLVYSSKLSFAVPAIVLLAAPIYWIVMARRHEQAGKLFFRASEKASLASAFFYETLAGQGVLRTFDAGGRRVAKYTLFMKTRVRHQVTAQYNTAFIQATAFAAQGLLSILVLAAGVIALRQGKVGIGSIVTANAMVLYLWSSSQALMQDLTSISRYKPYLARMAETLQSLQSNKTYTSRSSFTQIHGSYIKLQDVSFSYPEATLPVLQDVSLAIEKGERVLFTGANGAGKTTLFKLLAGTLAPSAGKITICNKVIESNWNDSLFPETISAPQETFLFQGSIQENICLGDPDASLEAVTEILRLVELHKEINLEARISGNQGAELSGGQRQKLGLARALICHPSILLLDEPSASLDVRSSNAVLKAIFDRVERQTILVISHKLFELQGMIDRHFHLEDGKVSEVPVDQKYSPVPVIHVAKSS